MTPIVLRVAELRKAKGLSQAELARRAGVRPATLSAIEAGGAWTSETLERLAKALGADPAFLIVTEREAPKRRGGKK